MRPSQNLSHFGTSSKDQLGGFCVKRDLDPEAMSKKDKMEKWIEMDWNSRIFIHLHVSESASKFLAKELGNRCLSSQALHQTHPLRSWCRIELWVRTPGENACHGHLFFAPRWSVSLDKVPKWCKAYLTFSILLQCCCSMFSIRLYNVL